MCPSFENWYDVWWLSLEFVLSENVVGEQVVLTISLFTDWKGKGDILEEDKERGRKEHCCVCSWKPFTKSCGFCRYDTIVNRNMIPTQVDQNGIFFEEE